ncbi:MAG: DUF433 domain-containing protein [Dehalococcoidia bacterium]
MTTATVDISTLIEQIPGVNGGKPFVSSAGVSVHQVSILFNEGASPEEIVGRYEGLTLAGVYAALAHYFANREQVEAELAAELALYEELRAAHPGGWRRGE